jgi:hypothetical protein
MATIVVLLAKIVCRSYITLKQSHPERSSVPRIIQAADAKHHGDEFPPSRPGPMLFLITAIVIATVVTIMNWPTVATFTHFPQIKSSLGL